MERPIRLLALTALTFAIAIAATTPTARSGTRTPPEWWIPGATCIHTHESRDWHWGPQHHPGQARWNYYYGGFQFVLRTWQSTWLPGEPRGYIYWHPEAASPAEQFWHAYVNWLHNGHRFGGGQWPNSSRACGLP